MFQYKLDEKENGKIPEGRNKNDPISLPKILDIFFPTHYFLWSNRHLLSLKVQKTQKRIIFFFNALLQKSKYSMTFFYHPTS